MTDEQWALIDPLMPSSGRGGQWRDHRQDVDGILWQLRTGAPWRDVPERYGPWKTLHERLRRWTADGTWDRVLEHLQTGQEDAGRIEWVFSIDSSVVRAHQHAPGARLPGGCTAGIEDLALPGEAPGRSRGGLSTKIHLATDARGLPVVVLLTPGQAGDNPQLLRLLDQVRVNTSGPGRPRKRPDCVLADRAYSSPSTRRALRERGNPIRQPGEEGPRRPQAAQGVAGRASSRVRRGSLQGQERGRAVLQPSQAIPGSGDQVRETGGVLPGSGRDRRDHAVAALIHRTGPRSTAPPPTALSR